MENQILDDGLTQTEPLLVPASKGKRFANLIIDHIIIMPLLWGIFSLAYLSGMLVPDENGHPGIAEYIINILWYAIYYILSEGLLNGKSIGKYITGTRAVTINGEQMNGGMVLKRSFSRLIPFEALSFFGSTSAVGTMN